MESTTNRMVRRRSLTERLGLKGIGCCGGAAWGITANNISVDDDDGREGIGSGGDREIDDDDDDEISIDIGQTEQVPACLDQTPASVESVSGMNLAAALAAERNYRSEQVNSYGNTAGADSDSSPSPRPNLSPGMVEEGINNNGSTGTSAMTTKPGTPLRVSLMKLLQETDGCDRGIEKEREGGDDRVCCVCMVRKKGAAFIPCGHTFCRVCSRELWLNRGLCPLCNRSIIEILDIF